jgi:nucleoid-associated protein EbfC
MAKRSKKSRGGGMPGAGGGANQAALLKQMQKMQEDMAAAQKALETETIDVTAGGGAITVTITGHQRVQAIKIDPDIIDVEDEDWATDLQDLLVAAVNSAIEQSQAMASERMESITGNMGGMLPSGLQGLL